MQAPEVGSAHRFVALDSLRGLCACTVVLFHFGPGGGTIGSSIFVHQGWLFVDFFFVLSGFVIDRSYGRRLEGGFPIRRFLFLRLARIYPLHVFMLALFVLAELAILLTTGASSPGRHAFDEGHSLPALLMQLGLVQIFGIFPHLTWNGPSWSIAAELWTYALFAILYRFTRGYLVPVALVLAAAGCGYLYVTGDGSLDRSVAQCLPRCIYGFSWGIVASRVYSALSVRLRPSLLQATVAEIAAMASCIVFLCVSGHGPLTLPAPAIFFTGVVIFAFERGLLSALLRTPLFATLGTLSYSIYMTHTFVIMGIKKGLVVVDSLFHVRWIAPSTEIVAHGVAADLISFGGLAVIIGFSAITRRLVELPCQRYARLAAVSYGVARAERLAPDM